MASMRRGDKGPEIKLLQGVLSKLNYGISEIDGVFGGETLDALKEFQSDMGLEDDGVAGDDTVTALIGALWESDGES